MRLKKIELHGFKSFADRTEIIFDEGVTCVVGPNGCGKSNISDSIRWVLGERSAKLLRGTKMEDVIFNGTDFRKPVAYAEVNLTIDNEDRGLPIDYHEVTLTRRLHRTGESEYLINKTACRLKDIQDLILDTGIGSSSYSMIEQGRIDYILNADADERRFLIEEAAGISKYKVKKEEAIRKLKRTEDNRLRLNDIVHEVHKNIQYAERQARKAERYKNEYEKLKRYETIKAFQDLNNLGTEKGNIGNERTAFQNQISETETAIENANQSQETLGQALQEINDRFQKAEANRYSIQSKLEQNQQQQQFNQEKRVQMAERRGQIDQEKIQITESIRKGEEEIKAKQNEIESLKSEEEKARETFLAARKSLEDSKKTLAEAKQGLDQMREDVTFATSKCARARSEFHKLSAILESSKQQKQKHEAGAKRLQEEAIQWKEKRESCEQEITTFEEKLANLNRRKATLEEELKQKKLRFEQVEHEKRTLEKKFHEHNTRLEMLFEIDQASKTDTDALLEGDSVNREFVEQLRDLFYVRPGFEWALDCALETFSHSLVASNRKTAERLIEKIQSQQGSSIGLFIRQEAPFRYAENQPRLEHPQVLHALEDVVEIKAGYESIFRPILQNTYIVETLPVRQLLDTFLPLSQKYRLISQQGISLGANSKIFCRNLTPSSEQNQFYRKAEIEKLRETVTTIEADLESHKNHLQENEAVIAETKRLLEQIEEERMDAAVRKESFESMLEGMKDRLISYEKEIQLNLFEFGELDGLEKETSEKIASLEIEVKEAEAAETTLRARENQHVQQIDDLDRQKGEKFQDFADQKARFDHLEERLRLFDESLTMFRQHKERDQKRIQALEEEAFQIGEKTTQLDSEDTQLIEEHGKLENDRRDADVASELVRKEKEAADEELQTIREKMQDIAAKQQALQTEIHQLEKKELDLSYQEKQISERLQQTYRINLEDLNAQEYVLDEGETQEQLDQTLETLRKKVESLGTVNMLAIEEYEELKQRYEFLMKQQNDLDQARDQLMETIRKINKTTKGLFEQTFKDVQENFQGYYETLFRGGQARLIMLDEGNPLESGIDIMVRPPGKKLQNLSLLSGGEKALTAIALLFSLFKIKPSPFCVLDEVDAPLDEANIDRFLAVLKTFLKSSQFIIVTHNRKTISMGDALYGVTMQEPGVSKLVSVKVGAETEALSEEETKVNA